MVTRTVDLSETQADLIDRLVARGRFRDTSEAMQAGLRLLEREEGELTDLRARLTASLEQARRGDVAEGSGEEAIRRAFAVARGEPR